MSPYTVVDRSVHAESRLLTPERAHYVDAEEFESDQNLEHRGAGTASDYHDRSAIRRTKISTFHGKFSTFS